MAKRTRISSFTKEDILVIREVARNIVNLPEFLYDEIKDVEQELAIGLFKESINFRSQKSSWATFRQKILMQIAGKLKRDRMKPSARYMIPPAHSLNETNIRDANGFDEIPTLMDAVTNDFQLADGTEDDGVMKIGLVIDVRAFIINLPAELRDVCEAIMKYDTQTAVAESLNISQATASRRIAEIRQRMIAAGLDQYLPAKRGNKGNATPLIFEVE